MVVTKRYTFIAVECATGLTKLGIQNNLEWIDRDILTKTNWMHGVAIRLLPSRSTIRAIVKFYGKS